MPFTPFHFGPAALVHSAAPRHISFLAFCGANVLVDVEPLYYMITGGYPIHRFLHTHVGATVAGLICVLLFGLVRRFAMPVLRLLRLENLSVRAVALGAFAGTCSHVVLDSLMHADMRPFAPFSAANPLLGAISLRELHGICLITGVVGAGMGLEAQHGIQRQHLEHIAMRLVPGGRIGRGVGAAATIGPVRDWFPGSCNPGTEQSG